MLAAVFLSFITLFQPGIAASDLVVQIQDGLVKGKTISSPDGSTFNAWRGIPFATPPLGELRYIAPQKPKPWSNVLEASQSGPACINAFPMPGFPLPSQGDSEDCLTINVYTPTTISQNLPVLFWIYGGGFTGGNADFNFYDPTPFLLQDVIVVTFNYRLGLFGFLSTEDSVIPGNAGLKDQLLALQWTKDNIASFGGDPERVTIFGESAGAISVGYHLNSLKSRNLFSAAIMESGNSILNVNTSEPRATAYSLAKQFSSEITDGSDSSDVRAVLVAASADDLTKAASIYTLRPILEPESEDAFLYKPNYEQLEEGNFARVPVMLGYNSEESLTFYPTEKDVKDAAEGFDADSALLVPAINLKNQSDIVIIGQQIKEVYVGETEKFSDNLAATLDYLSDDLIRAIYKDAIFRSQFVSVYMYQFSFYGTSSQGRYVIPGAGKVGHGDEMAYLFNISTFSLKTQEDFLARDRLVKLWTNFAKTYNPTPEEDNLLQNISWKAVSPDNVQYLDIGDDLIMKPNERIELTAFWDYIWEKYAQRPYNTF